MRDQHDLDRQLDDLLDALTAGQSPAAPDNPELAALVDTARRIRGLDADVTDPGGSFPTRLAAALERELSEGATRPAMPGAVISPRGSGGDNTSLPPGDLSPIPLPERQRWLPEMVRLVAAIAGFALVGIVLVFVLRGSGDGNDALVGASPPVASSVDATATGLIPDESGIYHPRSFAEAQELVPYRLFDPAPMLPGPEGLFLAAIEVQPSSDGAADAPLVVQAAFALPEEKGMFGMEQRDGQCVVPDMDSPEHSSLQVWGVSVSKVTGIPRSFYAGFSQEYGTPPADQQHPVAIYSWQAGGTCIMVGGLLEKDVSETLIEQLVTRLLIPTSEAAPTPTTPDISAFTDNRALLTVTPDTSVILRGRGFMPETSVAIFGGPLSGERRGSPVLDTMVASDGTFSAMLDPATLRLACPDALPDQPCRLSAVLGSMTTIVDTDAPSAFTVYTFAERAPAEVLERAPQPSCGVDIALNDPSWDAGAGQAARECLIAAADTGLPAELTYLQQTVEGDFVIGIYRLNGGGLGEIYIDSTRDRSGTAGWTVATCEAPVTDGRQPGGLVFGRCGEPTPIE